MFHIDANSGTPIYRQVSDQIRRLISSGKLKPGDTIPSVREVAIANTVNPMTISKAYALAETEGLLVRHRGKPMTVANRPITVETQTQRLEELEPLFKQLIDASEQLNLDSTSVSQYFIKYWKDANNG